MRVRVVGVAVAVAATVGGTAIGACAKFGGEDAPADAAAEANGPDGSASPVDARLDVDMQDVAPAVVVVGPGIACGNGKCEPPMVCCSGAIGEAPRCIARTETCDGGVTRDCDDSADCPPAVAICCMAASTGGQGSFCAAGCEPRYQMCSNDRDCLIGPCHVVACGKVAASLCGTAGCPSP